MSGSDSRGRWRSSYIRLSKRSVLKKSVPLLSRVSRSRPLKSLAPGTMLAATDEQEVRGLSEWKHYHHENAQPLNYKFAAITPRFGKLVLATIYSMSGPGNIIDTYATAKSYRSYITPFFRWLREEEKLFVYSNGNSTSTLPPEVFDAYKRHLDVRVREGSLQSKSAYQYKGAMVRLLHRVWLADNSRLGPGWSKQDFQHDEFDDDTRQREPYSAAEARRILDSSLEALSDAVKGRTIDYPYDEIVEISTYTAISLMIGIESECLDNLKLGNVRPSSDGKVMKITYRKRRVRTHQGRSRTTDPVDPLPEDAAVTEQIGSFRTAGGLLALMRKRAETLGKGAEDTLWLKRISAAAFRNYTDFLFSRGLRCDQGSKLPISRTRFRVTYKSAKTVRAKGKLALVSDDNTPDVKARHYLESERMKPFYEQAIENAGLEAIAYIPHNKPLLKLAAKELLYYRLNLKLSPTINRLSPYTAVREQVRLKRFIRWLDNYYPDVTCLTQINQGIVHAYRKWLENHAEEDALEEAVGGNHRSKRSVDGAVSQETVWSYMSPLKSYDLYQEFLTRPMDFSPYSGKLSARFLGVPPKSKRANSTPPIADDVLHPLVKVSMRYLDYYVPDIQAMAADRLAYWAELDDGSAEPARWRTTISECPELGKPWRSPLVKGSRHINHEFRDEMGYFISACSVLILYLSGMRPYEICALKKDCLEGVLDPITGEIVRWRVRGIPAKKRSRNSKTHPKMVTWVVPELAARAIKAIQEVLEPFRRRIGSDLLILNLDAFMRKVERSDVNKPGMDERSLGL